MEGKDSDQGRAGVLAGFSLPPGKLDPRGRSIPSACVCTRVSVFIWVHLRAYVYKDPSAPSQVSFIPRETSTLFFQTRFLTGLGLSS